MIITYLIYIVVSIGFTIWVGQNLFSNGRIFLLEAFKDDAAKADAVNKLLLVGFYLVNLGIVSLFLSLGKKPTTDIGAFEFLAVKFGVVLVVLGGMHYYNMRNIANMSSKARRKLEGELNETANR